MPPINLLLYLVDQHLQEVQVVLSHQEVPLGLFPLQIIRETLFNRIIFPKTTGIYFFGRERRRHWTFCSMIKIWFLLLQISAWTDMGSDSVVALLHISVFINRKKIQHFLFLTSNTMWLIWKNYVISNDNIHSFIDAWIHLGQVTSPSQSRHIIHSWVHT